MRQVIRQIQLGNEGRGRVSDNQTRATFGPPDSGRPQRLDDVLKLLQSYGSRILQFSMLLPAAGPLLVKAALRPSLLFGQLSSFPQVSKKATPLVPVLWSGGERRHAMKVFAQWVNFHFPENCFRASFRQAHRPFSVIWENAPQRVVE